ncbi:MAG: hypothetical protein AAGA65_17335 [Actinomycetota bacterium]
MHDAVLDLSALRKAAVLAHWVPGVNLVVSQLGGPAIAVTADPTLTIAGAELRLRPCELRDQVLGLMAPAASAADRLFDLGGPAIHIGVVTAPGTQMDEEGIVLTSIDDKHTGIAHAFVVDRARADSVVPTPPKSVSCGWEADAVPLVEHLDEELGVVMVTCLYHTDDVGQATAAYGAVFDAMITGSAEEFAALAAAPNLP